MLFCFLVFPCVVVVLWVMVLFGCLVANLGFYQLLLFCLQSFAFGSATFALQSTAYCSTKEFHQLELGVNCLLTTCFLARVTMSRDKALVHVSNEHFMISFIRAANLGFS